jgi:hypothetical protein
VGDDVFGVDVGLHSNHSRATDAGAAGGVKRPDRKNR